MHMHGIPGGGGWMMEWRKAAGRSKSNGDDSGNDEVDGEHCER